MKRFRPHNYRSKGQLIHQKTQKIIEQQIQKEIFFDAVLKEIEIEFEEQHLELFFQHLQTCSQAGKKKKQGTHQENEATPSDISRNSQCPIAVDEGQQVPFRKLDTGIFLNFEKRLFPVRYLAEKQPERKFLSTPKYQKKEEKVGLCKRLFDVDAKMKRNYQRVKQRLGLNSGQDTLRAFNSIRNSETLVRTSKTQRGHRFRTEGEEQQWVPKMLMGDLQLKCKARKLDTRAEDRRMECFLSRYKIDQ